MNEPKRMETLRGSEKQIAWARQIRKNLLSNPANDGIEDRLAAAENAAEIADLENMRTAILNQESASWFIDNRGILSGYHRWEEIVSVITRGESGGRK